MKFVRSVSCFIILMMISISPLSFADSGTKVDDSQQPLEIFGHSKLSFLETLSPGSEVNATWELQISIGENYGTDLLPNQSLGIRTQIDRYIGDDDGYLTENETASFSQLITSARSWDNSELAGCCIFDYEPLILTSPVNLTISPPLPGPVLSGSESSWGWEESADLVATSDQRSTRLLDLPRTGAIVEEVPLVVTLQSPWELKFSAMQEIISGAPSNFSVHRTDSPVYSTIRIAIGQNDPPSIVVNRTGDASISVPLDSPLTFFSECQDSVLESPQYVWLFSNNGTVVTSVTGTQSKGHEMVTTITPSDYGFSSADVLSADLKCKDSHDSSSNWYQSVIIDGENPTYEIRLTEITKSGIEIEHNVSDNILEIRQDSELYFDIIATDSSNLPVSITVTSNKSQGWRQFSNDELHFSTSFTQGAQVNGMHMPVEERHLQRDNALWNVMLNVSDEAGNTVEKTWEVLVEDSSAPVVMPSLFVNSDVMAPSNPPRLGDNLTLFLSDSFDDLDSIDNTMWTISVDGEIYVKDSNWSIAEKTLLPPLEIGGHTINIQAEDSSSNSGNLSFQFSIEPPLGFSIEVTDTSLSEKPSIGNSVTVTVFAKNSYSSVGSARLCHLTECSDFVLMPGGPYGGFTLQLEVTPDKTGDLDMSIEWIGTEDGESGTIELSGVINVADSQDNDSNHQIEAFLLVFSILVAMILVANRIWGVNSMKP